MEVTLGDKRYFEMFIGKRVLAETLHNSKGTIPVYSGNIARPFGYLGETRITDFDHTYVIWGIDDAVFDFGMIPKGTRFEITDHMGAIRILDGGVLPEYLLFALKLMKRDLDFGWGFRASMANMRKVAVDIPSLPDGSFDLDKQRELARKQSLAFTARQEIESQLEELTDAVIELDPPSGSRTVALSEIFRFPETNTGITKQFCLDNQGDVPVYASSKEEDAVIGRIKEGLRGIKYYRDSLTWNRNGSVGHIFYRHGVFTTNEDHRVMEVRSEFKRSLSLEFLRYVLWNEIRTLGYGFTHKLGKSRMEQVQVRIPVTPNGQFDLDAQIKMAKRYEEVYGIRNGIVQSLRALNDVQVNALSTDS